MEEWWEFRLALELAPKNLGEIFPLLWWFRSIWFWVPLIGVIWINDFINASGSWYRTSFLPFCLVFLLSIGSLLAKLTIPHPPCDFLKIQELIPHGFYFCEGMGGLPEINSLLMSGLLGYSILFCSFCAHFPSLNCCFDFPDFASNCIFNLLISFCSVLTICWTSWSSYS
jgi:hypothetical protein